MLKWFIILQLTQTCVGASHLKGPPLKEGIRHCIRSVPIEKANDPSIHFTMLF